MNFGIITHYDVHNHGALLQLTALKRVLQNLGIKAQALQFDKNYDFMGPEMKSKYNISLHSLKIYLNYIKDNGLKKTFYNYKKRKTLNKFKVNADLLGPYYTSVSNLNGVVIGSDEVFALHTGITPVMFGHCCPSEKVFSYAGSFGPTDMKDILKWHAKSIIQSGLNSMIGISVRDCNSQNLVETLTGIKPALVVDPVILYGYKDEIAQLSRPNQPKYLLIYAYDNRMNDSTEINQIKAFAKSRGLKIISPGFYHSWCDQNIDVDPINLLAYFKYADCVVTDTFHGTVMSLITGANVSVKLRDNSNKLLNLMEEYGIINKQINNFENLGDIVDSGIDWLNVEKSLETRRSNSMEFLNQMIKLCRQTI